MKTVKLFLLLCLPFKIFALTHWSEHQENGFNAKVHLSSDQLRLQDQLTIEVVTEHPATHHVDADLVKEALKSEEGLCSIISEEIAPEPIGNGQMRTTLRYRLEPHLAGDFVFAFLPLRFLSEKALQKVEFFPEVFCVHIHPPEEQRPEIAQAMLLPLKNRPLMEVASENKLNPLEQKESHAAQQHLKQREFPWRWLFLAVIMVTVFVAWRRYGTKITQALARHQQVQQPINAREKALHALQQLVSEQLPYRQLYDLFYVRLTSIVRRYIEDDYHIKAPELTTQEFLQCMTLHERFDAEAKQILQDFLFAADLVKFARSQPSLEDCAHSLQAAHAVVEKGLESMTSPIQRPVQVS